MNIDSVILSLSKDQFRLPFFRRAELILRLGYASLRMTGLLSFLLFVNSPLWADAPAGDPLAEALPILQARYVDFQALHYKQGDHLGDLIARSNGGISLGAPEAVSAPQPIVTATLPDGILYWRLASFTPAKSWPDLETQLQQGSGNTAGIILDLRSNIAPDDYAAAAQVMGLLAPEDFGLSKYKVGGDHGTGIAGRGVRRPMVVLINNQTTGAAEALAAFLKADGALVVGRATCGKAAVFAEQKLASGQVLRFAVENILRADGTALWGQPISPDIGPVVNDSTERAALALIKDNHIADVIQESAERHRMSEASLVEGEDPEWDGYLASLEKKPVLLSLPVIHDAVLISALDSLKAICLSQRPFPAQATANASPPASSSLQ